jgi:hypothetical protein
MLGAPATAAMLRRDRGLHRRRKDGSDDRDEQKESGGHSLHVFRLKQNPKLG